MGMPSFWDNFAMLMGGIALFYFANSRRDDLGSKANWMIWLAISLVSSAVLQFIMEFGFRTGGH
jgi:hypothetical protein